MSILLWLTASLLALVALGFVLPALLRASRSGTIERSQVNVAIARERERELRAELDEGTLSDAEFDAARAELEQGLAIDLEGDAEAAAAKTTSPLVAAGVSAVLPLAALGLYLFLGTPNAIDAQNAAPGPDIATQGQQGDVDTLLAQLKARLVDRPDDVRGWTLLANVLMSTGQYADAVPAYRRLVELQPGDAERLVRLADALAMSRNGVLAGEPEQLVRQALTLAPMHPQGLWLAGIAAEQRGAYADALGLFNQLLPLVSDQPEVLTEVRALISQTTAALEGKPEATVDALRITISIDPSVAGTITPQDTLFVYARVPGGPPMPVAVRKLSPEPLPREVTLNNSDLMLPGAGLGSYPKLQVGAHISRSGTVTQTPGDLLGSSEAFNPAKTPAVKVVIASTVSE
ncbi:MAG TPA: c-type cytochrome biogenesis protein CcmI [Gammaproteobacteria bacterium]|jgi:cytochrome c-type biogenesis protein CcmH|nr:c-type cytochrome biogenesis protein CcmI [Acidiferrobacteraceae bacterium]MDP6551047.1 c-type cytochrome biogenesis protein CcmI [Arenicellales bacterium]MDP6791842.1 c-type cytochrome biogenesis protein CcmI [Arenicellales bacterium]MDP6918294.1 c-type cytochrome biogenesis protein CcmI [Arenicellales bacterium]HCX86839.1 c-type cytochrome biogenesis protein CcmI [Gammaproteobacteria bacterium]|tara:strand:+ start:1094 stop:2305 length:1212 start_codon:yes stop_codon:yes gene_type:complete